MNALVDVSFFPRNAKPLNSYRKFWAARFGTAPFLPMSRAEMTQLGWDSCDIVLVTGDAYVDHPSFGMAVIGRMLEAQGFRVGIIAQPDWQSPDPFRALGKPNLFWGVTAGNMDSMINRYTADRKIRSDDAYTPGDVGGKRPDRAAIVYSQRCREAFPDVPIVLGGIEGSLRRIAHYDYWSDKVRRSIVVDSKCDLPLYGNAERAVVEKIDDKVSIKMFQGYKHRREGKPWFKINKNVNYISVNTKTGDVYHGYIHGYQKKKKCSKSIRRNCFINDPLNALKSQIKNVLTHYSENAYDDVTKAFSEFMFQIDQRQNFENLNYGDRLLRFYLNKRGIKYPNNFNIYSEALFGPEIKKLIKKNNNRLVDAVMLKNGLTGKKVKKALHECTNLNINLYRTARKLFGQL